MRLLSVLGASSALGDHLLRHPDHWRDLTDPTLGSTRPAAAYDARGAAGGRRCRSRRSGSGVVGEDAEAVDALRVEYRRLLLRLAARDLSHDVGVDDVAAELSDLAAGTLDAALAIARARWATPLLARGSRSSRWASAAATSSTTSATSTSSSWPSRSTGATSNAALRAATQLASHLMRICSDHTGEGTIWPVDAALRPEGKSGPLVRTLASHQGYYERWAKTWEFQALLKARPVAGDARARARVRRARSRRWSGRPRERDGFVTDVQAMRRRVIEHIPAAQADRQIKLGAGGLRDVEFAVQLLQLVHGRADPEVRAACDALGAGPPHPGRVRRTRGRCRARRGLPLPAHARAPHAARQAAPRRTSCRRTRSRLRRLGRSLGMTRDPVAELEKLAPPQPRGPPAAREALLPAAARRRSRSCPTTRPGSPRRLPSSGSRLSATTTRRPRCGTWRR